MESKISSIMRWLLRNPAVPQEFPEEELYNAACIGAVTLLYEMGDSDGLYETIRFASSPESQRRAMLALGNLARASGETRAKTVRHLHELAILDDNRSAANYISMYRLRDTDAGWNSARMLYFEERYELLRDDPYLDDLSTFFLDGDQTVRYRLLELGEDLIPDWCALMRFLDHPIPEYREKLLEGFGSFTRSERKMFHFCAEMDHPVSSLPADLFLRYEDETLLKICLEYGLQPSDPSQAALFFFLSGQWDRYYASDSDYRRIRIAYEKNDPELQRRLIAVSRDSGNNAWLRDVNSGSENQPSGGSLSDQHLLAASLIEQKEWDRLWKLLPGLPVLCMGEVCDALQQNGFSPKLPDEKAFFSDLRTGIADCEGLSPIPIREKLWEGGGVTLGICGGGPYIAVVFADRSILVWDKRSIQSKPLRISSNHLTFRQAVITHDGKYLCADCGAAGITLFSLPAGQAVKTIPAGDSPLTGLFIQKDDRRLITLHRTGKGKVFSFPGGIELRSFDLDLKDCERSAYDAGNNHLCGVTAEGNVSLYDLNGYRLLNAVRTGSAVLSVPDRFSRNRLSFIFTGDRCASVHLLSGKAVREIRLPEEWKVRRIMT
ncbi:MAG: hypothetical protein IKP86_00075, partial [Anaerolineaceae bacterium]|nr:hypothetical protein [Anaerolineaceae bacterium]